jgi:sugar phosphate isomerase/epimerase
LKITASNIAWSTEHDEQMYTFFKNNNILGLEIAPTRIFEENPYDNQEKTVDFKFFLKNNYNLQVVSMQSICYGKSEAIFNSESERNTLYKYIEKSIIFAENLNCNNLVFGCPKNRNISAGQEQIAIDYFRKIGNLAEKHNTVFALEPNPVIYGTNFINTTNEAFDFVKKCNSTGLKVNLDLGTIIYNNENLKQIEDNINLINHVHISEPYLEKIEPKTIHNEIADLLRKNRYKNYISIEMRSGQKTHQIQETINYIQDVFHN